MRSTAHKIVVVIACLALAKVVFLLGFLRLGPVLVRLAFGNADQITSFAAKDLSNEADQISIDPHVGRTVIMLVDALRWDFVYSSEGRKNVLMPNVAELYKQGLARFCLAHAHPPTVTMPRLKALTTGMIPDFSDVIMNFASPEVLDPSFVSEFNLRSRGKILLYGDETWLKMYPHSFERHDGTTSFFVTDYTEVDRNVTRHLGRELKADDWKLMILHYLGVDHIGHLAGPWSPLMRPKLLEMDQIVKDVYTGLTEHWDGVSPPPLLVVLGDHGMGDLGSHGGASRAEVDTPIAFFSPGFIKSDTTVVKFAQITQPDFAAQMSLLFGLPLPSKGIGRPISHLVDLLRHKDHDLAKGLLQAGRVLLNLVKGKTDKARMWEDKLVSAYKEYMDGSVPPKAAAKMLSSLTLEMQEFLEREKEGFDLYMMLVGVMLYAATLLVMLFSFDQDPGIVCLSFNAAFLACIGFFFALHNLCVITKVAGADVSFVSSWYLAIPLQIVLSALTSWATLGLRAEPVQAFAHRRSAIATSFLRVFPLMVPWAQALSSFASSFVEEEHQFWFAVHQAVLFLAFLHIMEPLKLLDEGGTQDMTERYIGGLPGGPVRSILESIQLKSARSPLLPTEPILMSLLLLGASLVMRVSRDWSHTGAKWATLPDISDWLQVHPVLLWEAVLLSSVLVGFLSLPRPFSIDSVFFLLTLPLLALFHGHKMEGGDAQGSEWPIPLLCFMLIFILIGRAVKRKNTSTLKSAWLLLGLLLTKSSSYPWISLLTLSEALLSTFFTRLHLPADSIVFIFVVFGMSGYFQQGNSNSLASLDIASGYVGLPFYHPLPTGILLACNTYFAPIYFLISLIGIFQEKGLNGKDRHFSSSNLLFYLTLFVAVQSFFYSIVISLMRNHLFIFSVFAPKLLYDGFFSFILLLASLPAVHFLRT